MWSVDIVASGDDDRHSERPICRADKEAAIYGGMRIKNRLYEYEYAYTYVKLLFYIGN